ncbi:diguanylate cyclase [Pseudohongiella nitratireducens]|uniref:bifunctional diguanylate cyclase/phosphodiesterase n=1 Tax=Pseudohongiella nitratireducens TaxID=1768907 RepID=UPI0030EB846D
MTAVNRHENQGNDFLVNMGQQCPDGFWYENLSDSKQSWISDAFWRSIGCPAPSSFPGSIIDTWLSMISPNQTVEIKSLLEACCQNPEQAFNEVIHFLSPEGVSVWMKCQLLVLSSSRGEPSELLCWHSNVTDMMTVQSLQETSNRIANIGYWQVDLRSMLSEFSDITQELLGLTRNQQVPISDVLDVTPDQTSSRQIKKIFDDIVKTRKSCDEEVVIGKDNESQRWVRLIGFPEIIQGECRRLYGTIQDVTEQKRREEALWQSEEAFRNNFIHAGIGMALVATNGTWLQVNRTLCGMIGYAESELMKLTFQDITHPEDLDNDLILLNEVVEGKREHYQMEKRYFHKKGHIVHVLLSVSVVRNKDQSIKNFISQIIDISDLHEAQRKVTGLLRTSKDQNKELMKLQNQLTKANKVLKQENQTDPLTGLGNRRAFHLAINEVLSSRRYKPLGIAMIDVDHFKKYNDTYGHLEGDLVLKKLGNVLRRCVREQDTVIRFGGEEFSVIMPGSTLEESRVMAERVRKAIAKERFPNQGITVSIGVSSRSGEDDIDTLLKRADEALYDAKANGRNCVATELKNPGSDNNGS